MKSRIDQLIQDQELQAFLTWVSQKSRVVTTEKKPVIVRAFYFDLAFARALGFVGSTLDLTRALDRNFTCKLDSTLALDLALDRALAFGKVVELTTYPSVAFERVVERVIAHAHAVDPMLERSLQQLKEQLPDRDRNVATFKQWWSVHGQTWTEQLRDLMMNYRSLDLNWQFNEYQKEAIKHYYDANLMLVDCLNSNCHLAGKLRKEIEETLLLPIAEVSQISAKQSNLRF